MTSFIYISPLLFSLADAFMYRAKTKPVNVWHFNLFLELSKLCYLATFIGCIMIGINWQRNFIVPLILMHFVAKSIPFNLASGLKWNYIGVGVFDSFIKIVTQGSLWMWLILQGVCLAFSYFILMNKL